MTGTLHTTAQALALLERERVLTLVPVANSGRRALVTEVVGGPVRGSWWAHPQGELIYRIAEELEASGQVLVCKLVAGKVTFVHRALWPLVLRVVTDAAWRKRAARDLTPAARELLKQVEAHGPLRVTKAQGEARKLLEAAQLVLGVSQHTEKGAHVSVLQSWQDWARSEGVAAATGPLKAAQAELVSAGIVL